MTFLSTLSLFNVGIIFVNFISGLYTSVAKAYSLLMTFAAGGTNTSIANSISEFTKSAYTLVGIFMVFRLAISILTYLIDPEKMNDKQVGTGKLISRIVVSVVLLLSLNTIIFPTLTRIETALLDSDSIIFNIFPNPFDTSNDDNGYWNNMNTTINNKVVLNKNFNSLNTIIPSVKAANDCTTDSIFNTSVLTRPEFIRNVNGDSNIIVLEGCNYNQSNTKDLIRKILGIYYYDNSIVDSANFYILNASNLQAGHISFSFYLKDGYSSNVLSDCPNKMTDKSGRRMCLNNINSVEVPTNDAKKIGTIEKIKFSSSLDNDYDKVNATIYYYISATTSTESISLYYTRILGDVYYSDKVKLTFNSNEGISVKGYNGKDTGTNTDAIPIYLKSAIGDDTSIKTAKFGNTCHYKDGLGPGRWTLITDVDTKDPHCASTFTLSLDGNLQFNKTVQNNGMTNYICGNVTLEGNKECSKKYGSKYKLQAADGDEIASAELREGTCEEKNGCDECILDEDNKNYVCKNFTSSLINGLGFARSVLSSFTDKPDVITGEVEEGTGKFLESAAANDALGTMAEDKEIMFDWFLAIIAGIGVIIYMWILCIEVIVRNMKLILLQIIAPIPVICYMNPNDKILNSWFKQYIGTYLDLFIKLLAINAGFRFIPLVIEAVDPSNGFATFLIYCGGFLFIKAAPAFISKTFGLENMAGTFKDAAGIVKSGISAGVGAVAGGVAGAATGFGKGGNFSTVAGGLFGGAARGLSSGAKGKIFDGAKTQIGRNKSAKSAYMDGASWKQRMLSKVGMDAASRTDRSLKDLESDSKQYEAFKKHKDSIDQTAESSNFIKDLRSQKLADGSARYSESQIKTARKNFINHNSNTNNKGYVSSFEMTDNAGNKVMISAGYEDSKASAIQSELTKAEYNRSGSETISKVADAKISDYGSLDAADTAITIEKTATDEAIYAAKNTDAYRVGDASRNSNNNGNK